MSDVYQSPEKHGLRLLGEAQWGEACYDFDLTAVWQDTETGQLYYADDIGCSCPSPFEEFYTRDQLTAATRHEVLAHLQKRAAEKAPTDGADLIERVAALQ